MFAAEAEWIAACLAELPAEALSPMLNVGSSTAEFRQLTQPWIQTRLLDPVLRRRIEIVHLDFRAGSGIDLCADLLHDGDFAKLGERVYGSLLCCNILEHVLDPAKFARRCVSLVRPGGAIAVTVPRSYPRHGDPIDTMFRPTTAEVADLFPGTEVLADADIDAGESYLDEVRRRPAILLRHLARLPVPFLGWEKWRASMTKPYWLFHNYRVTAVLLRRRPVTA